MNKTTFMKRIWIVILLIAFISNISFHTSEASLRVNHDIRETRFVDGVRHTYIQGEIDFNGTKSNQKINYIGANPTQDDTLHVVTSDNYAPYGFGMGNMNLLIDNIHQRFDNYHVIGGVNADFYNTNTGEPVSPVIRNFELIYPGLTTRKLVGFKDNGEVVFGNPCFEGYELKVFNEDQELKKTIELSGINRVPQNPNDVTVFFSNFKGVLNSSYNQAVMNAIEIKIDASETRYFGKGSLAFMSTSEHTIEKEQFVIVGQAFNNDDLITATDYVIVQQNIGCGFEDVRFAVGGWEELVTNGVPNTNFPQGAGPYLRHPRTAVGVKQNGEVFFVVIDGRNYTEGFLGVTAPEMAEIMVFFGAHQAINLDGGGSSTMLLENDEKSGYDVLNTPSDGRLRSVSNGIFFVRGTHTEIPNPIPFPDTREQLHTPKVFVDENGNIHFDEVPNASQYKMYVNGEVIETHSNTHMLHMQPGTYTISVRAFGDRSIFRPSTYSNELIYTVYEDDFMRFIRLFRGYAKKETE